MSQTTGILAKLIEATAFWAARNRVVTRARVGEVVGKLLAFKSGLNASERYLKDLRLRLSRFYAEFPQHISDITTSEIQDWLDCLGLSNCSYGNYRRVLHIMFEFAVARGFAVDNPVKAMRAVKADKFAIQIFTPTEMRKLLGAASNEFLPSIVLGAFAGLRRAEIQVALAFGMTSGWLSGISLSGKTKPRRQAAGSFPSGRTVPLGSLHTPGMPGLCGVAATPSSTTSRKTHSQRSRDRLEAQRATPQLCQLSLCPDNGRRTRGG